MLNTAAPLRFTSLLSRHSKVHCTLVLQVKLRFCPGAPLPTSLLRHLDSQREVPRRVTSTEPGMCAKCRFPGSSLATLLRGPLPSMLLGRSRDPRLLCMWLIGSTHPLVHVVWFRMPLGVPRLSLLTPYPHPRLIFPFTIYRTDSHMGRLLGYIYR